MHDLIGAGRGLPGTIGSLTPAWKHCPDKHAASSHLPWDRQDHPSPHFLELSPNPHPPIPCSTEEPALAAPGTLVFLWLPWQKFCHESERTQQTPWLRSVALLEAEKEILVKEKLGQEERDYFCSTSLSRNNSLYQYWHCCPLDDQGIYIIQSIWHLCLERTVASVRLYSYADGEPRRLCPFHNWINEVPKTGWLKSGLPDFEILHTSKRKYVIMRQAYLSCPLTFLNTTSYHQCPKTKEEYLNYNNRRKKDPYLRRKSLKLNKFSLREN